MHMQWTVVGTHAMDSNTISRHVQTPTQWLTKLCIVWDLLLGWRFEPLLVGVVLVAQLVECPSSQGWAPGVRPFFVCACVYCVSVLFVGFVCLGGGWFDLVFRFSLLPCSLPVQILKFGVGFLWWFNYPGLLLHTEWEYACHSTVVLGLPLCCIVRVVLGVVDLFSSSVVPVYRVPCWVLQLVSDYSEIEMQRKVDTDGIATEEYNFNSEVTIEHQVKWQVCKYMYVLR